MPGARNSTSKHGASTSWGGWTDRNKTEHNTSSGDKNYGKTKLRKRKGCLRELGVGMLHRMGKEGLEGEQRLEAREWGT